MSHSLFLVFSSRAFSLSPVTASPASEGDKAPSTFSTPSMAWSALSIARPGARAPHTVRTPSGQDEPVDEPATDPTHPTASNTAFLRLDLRPGSLFHATGRMIPPLSTTATATHPTPEQEKNGNPKRAKHHQDTHQKRGKTQLRTWEAASTKRELKRHMLPSLSHFARWNNQQPPYPFMQASHVQMSTSVDYPVCTPQRTIRFASPPRLPNSIAV